MIKIHSLLNAETDEGQTKQPDEAQTKERRDSRLDPTPQNHGKDAEPAHHRRWTRQPLTPPDSPKAYKTAHRRVPTANRMAIDFMAPMARWPENNENECFPGGGQGHRQHFYPDARRGRYPENRQAAPPRGLSSFGALPPPRERPLAEPWAPYPFSSPYHHFPPGPDRRYSLGSPDTGVLGSPYHGIRRAPRPPYETKETYLIMFLRVERGLRWDQVLDVFRVVFAREQHDDPRPADDDPDLENYRSESGLSSFYYRKREEPYWGLGKVRHSNAATDKAKVRARLRAEGYMEPFLELLEIPAIQQIIRKPKQDQ